MSFETWIVEVGEDLQVALFFGVLGLCLVAERLAPRRAPPAYRRGRWWTNYALTALNLVMLIALPVSFIGAAAWADSRGIGLLNQVHLPLALAIAATFLARSFVSWLTHWLGHHVPIMWRFHRVHHLDTELDVSTTVRGHPFEFALNLVPGIPLVVAFGLSPWLLLVYELCDVVVVLFSHANVRIPRALDRALRLVVVTPDMHRIHHSWHEPETNSNYSAVFPIWDYVFGTYRAEPADSHETMALGLEQPRGAQTRSVAWLLASPFARADEEQPCPQ